MVLFGAIIISKPPKSNHEMPLFTSDKENGDNFVIKGDIGDYNVQIMEKIGGIVVIILLLP